MKKLVRVEIPKEEQQRLESLQNWGAECDCEENTETIELVHEGTWEEVFTTCLTCGGSVV